MNEFKRRNISDIPNPMHFSCKKRDVYMKKEFKNFLTTILSTIVAAFVITMAGSLYTMQTDITILKSKLIERENDIDQLRDELNRIQHLG